MVFQRSQYKSEQEKTIWVNLEWWIVNYRNSTVFKRLFLSLSSSSTKTKWRNCLYLEAWRRWLNRGGPLPGLLTRIYQKKETRKLASGVFLKTKRLCLQKLALLNLQMFGYIVYVKIVVGVSSWLNIWIPSTSCKIKRIIFIIAKISNIFCFSW